MRVLIDTTFADRAPLSGTGVYVAQLRAALAQTNGVEVVTAGNQHRRSPAGGGAGSLRNAAGDLWWLTVGLPRAARQARADLIHHPLPAHAYASAHVPGAAPVPQVITVHDLAFERLPRDFDRAFRLYARLVHRAAARTAGAVIAVSQTTAADVEELWGVAPSRIVVAPHGPGQLLRRLPATRATGFLYVGDEEPRKDLPTLLAAYARYRAATDGVPLELTLAGSVAPHHAPGVRREFRPTPERLAELYAGAAALVHPARYEGFGLTPLEAMRLGVPVIAARAPGVLEVCRQAALFYAPGDEGELVGALRQVATDPALRARLSNAGRARAAEFSWARSAQRHVGAYSLAIDG